MAVTGTLKFLLVAVTFAGYAAADNGDDFSNNLLSDLGPLLALFGEQVTMQFMSQSMGWSDNVILAMVPIGIITSIISAIRVGGPTWLKAIIGRARENFAAAEAELMSSTSNEVCELWNGNDIVRCMGTAPIAEFICLIPEEMESAGSDLKTSPKIMACDLDQALANGYLRDIDSNDQDTDSNQVSSKYRTESKAEKGQASTESSQPEIIIVRNTTAHAPNISLNSHSQFGRTEVRIVAVIGTILQLGILILATFAAYYPTKKFFKDGKRIAPYAFVCFVVGTILLVLGGLLCAHVVETSTDERVYRPGLGRKARIVWLQKTNAVSDQVFDSFALFPIDDRTVITTSHRASKLIEGHSLATTTVIGTMVSVCGFILQFIGFRGMSWIVTLTQLGAVLTMAGLRAWVRRGLAKPLRCKRLTPGLELEWFASTLRDIDRAGLDASNDKITCGNDWRIMTGGSPAHERLREDKEPMQEDSKAHSVMMTRRDLGQLADWRGPASAEAVALARALEVTMDALFSDSPARKFIWSLKAFCGDIHFRLERQQTGNWKAYSDEIEAALSLWLYSVNEQEHRHNKQRLEREEILKRARKDDAWLRAKGSPAKPSLRLLGPSVSGLHRDLHWWMPRDTSSRIVEVEEAEGGPLEVENHRVVGYGMDPSEDEDDSATLKEHRTDDGGSDPGLAYQQINKQTRQYNRQELAKLSFDQTDLSKGRTGDNYLAIESYSPLELLYAQDMFSAFIWAAAKTLTDPIGGDADLRPDETSGTNTWQFFTLRNDNLSKMAQDLQNTGIGSLEEIYLSIIPPLSMEHKLPQADVIIESARLQAKRHEQVGHWKDAGDVYLWLFRTAKTFPENSRIVARATAVLLEYLRQVVLSIDSGEVYHEGNELRQLEELKFALRKELRDNFPETVSNLMRLYEEQDRGWKCDGLQDDGPSEKTNAEYPKAFNFMLLHSNTRYNDPITEAGIRYMVEGGQNVNVRDIHDWTPLHYAADRGCVPVTNQLLLLQADVKNCDLIEWTPLHYACQRGHTEIIRMLLQWGADVNFQGRDKVTPLHCAAANGHQDVVRLLIEAGATIDILDASGNTPLFRAVHKGRKEMVEDLWTDANKKLRDYNGRTAMHLAAGAGGLDMVQLLANKLGADNEAKDRHGQTPLHRAAECGNEAVVRLLIDKTASREPTDVNRRTPLHLAARGRHEVVVRLLVNEFNADKDAEDSFGQKPLHMAVQSGNEALVRLLVKELGVDKETKGQFNKTPLHVAAECGQGAVARLLVKEFNANTEAKEDSGMTPLHSTVDLQQEALALLLVKECNANIESKTRSGYTPLHLASERGYEGMVRVLTQELNADTNAKEDNERTPLHFAADRGHEAVVRLLAQEPSTDKEAKDVKGQTPLHRAARRGEEAAVRVLGQEFNADTEAKDNRGRTPLHAAARFRQEATVRLLVQELKANMEAKDQDGKTPLQVAIGAKEWGNVQVLRELGAKE